MATQVRRDTPRLVGRTDLVRGMHPFALSGAAAAAVVAAAGAIVAAAVT